MCNSCTPLSVQVTHSVAQRFSVPSRTKEDFWHASSQNEEDNEDFEDWSLGCSGIRFSDVPQLGGLWWHH